MSPLSVDEWMNFDNFEDTNRSWNMMMHKVASFHSKHDFANPETNGHNMGYRIALTVEELADLLILILGHSLALEIDLYHEFNKKLEKVMKRPARHTKLGIRITEYSDE